MIRACPHCGQNNRIPARHLADRGRCGRCRAALEPLDCPIDVDAQAFDDITRNARVPVLVDFWAAWCAPCRMVGPEVAAVAQELAGQALVLKVDTERHPELAARFGVRGIPFFLVTRDGRVVQKQAGAVDRAQLRSWILHPPGAAAPP